MTLRVKWTTTGMGVQSPHPLETGRHNGTPEPTRKMYLGSDMRVDAKHRMGDPDPQILTVSHTPGFISSVISLKLFYYNTITRDKFDTI